MGRGFYTNIALILHRHKCKFVRQGKGSHEIWYSPITNKTFSVPVTVVSRNTANGILKQAGLEEKI
ncbi:type II toxin-antitoxin system HicA family toxin [Rahnella sp. CJA17(1/100)]|uniref:type II toxin-antitoxin system HicA family toxin n=1 Tax=Rahnella sp. CJA17(1/100) TaxID=2508951 RepID=UPI00106F9DBF|nr:type II toxin-antitoxin system HicA family toxin [Rahnella sp. CJA17(1/100)]